MRIFLVIFLSLSVYLNLLGQVPQNVFKLNELEADYTALNKYLFVWEDTSNGVSFQSLPLHKFSPYQPTSKAQNPYTSYWGKITIQSRLDRDTDWILYLGGFFINEAEVYICSSQDTLLKKTGSLLPLSEKDIKQERNANVSIFLPAQKEVTVFMKIHNIDKKPLQFDVRLERPYTWMQNINKRAWRQGIFQGFMWIMFAYHMLIYVYSRNKSYLIYSLYILSNSIYFFNYYFFSIELLFPEQPWLFLYFYILSTSCIPLFYVQFHRLFLNAQKNTPKYDKLMLLWIYIRLAEFALVMFLAIYDFNYHLVHIIHPNFALFEAAVFVIFLFFIFQKENRQTYFIVGGALCLHLGLVTSIVSSQYLKLGSGNLIFESGIVLEIFIFALGLGYKLKQSELEKRNYQSALINELQKNAVLLKQAQEVQLKSNQKLEVQVKERTRELHDLSDFKSQLLSIISHDFRSPLTNLKGVLSFLDSSELSEGEIKIIQRAMEQKVDNTLTLLDNLLNWSKSQMDGLVINKEEINLYQLIQDNIALFLSAIQSKQIAVLSEVPSDLVIEADHNMMDSVVRNLLSNAIKFTSTEGKIFIRAQQIENKVEIGIQDTGIGMSKEMQLSLLENKKVMNQTTPGTHNERGSGLGLLLCKDFIEKNNGIFRLESKIGEGTIFTFNLPIIAKK